MKQTFLAFLFLFAGRGLAQNNDSVQNKVYTYVEQMPEPGYDITSYLSKHLQYPDSAADNNIQGRVVVKFVVNEDGTISNCKVEKGIGGGCDKAALDVLMNMPKWKAGIHNGQAVKVQTMLPVTFALTEENRIFKYVDQMPIIGCDYYKYMTENLRYPARAIKKKTHGTAAINFVVNEDGSVSNVRNLNSIGDSCDEEAIRLISNMPKWTPGIDDGKPVKVLFNLPVRFDLEPAEHLYGDTSKHYNEQAPAPAFDVSTYLMHNLHYPDEAREKSQEGRVVVKFVVNENGSVSDCIVVSGIGRECDEEALRVVRNMPFWLPAIQKDRPVKVYFTLPIQFRLEGIGHETNKKRKIPADYVFDLSEHLDKQPSTHYDHVKYVSEHVYYPDSARAKGIQGDVIVKFVVKKDGTIGNCTIESSLGGGCDEEARRVVKSMPAWKPGISEKMPVNVYQIMAVPFYPSVAEKLAVESKQIYSYMDRPPTSTYSFPEYIARHLKYPEEAKKKRITGSVMVKFVVTDSGKIENVGLIRGIGGGCDEEAIRLVKNMPPWKPGEMNNRPVNSYFNVSVPFSMSFSAQEIKEFSEKYEAERPKREYDFLQYVSDSLHYPDSALENNIGGTVIISFSVSEKGMISKCIVSKSLGYGCDEEALRLVQNMPPWQPQVKDGAPMSYSYSQSIDFDLRGYKRQLKKKTKAEENAKQ